MIMLITESNDCSNYKEIVKNAISAAKRDGYDQFVYVDSNGDYGIIRSGDGEPVRKLFDDEKIVGKVRVIYRNGIRDAVYVTERPACESDVKKQSKKSFESKNTKISGRKLQEKYYDPDLDQFEIYLMTRGTDGQNEIREYVDSRRDTGIFGSIGSEYGNISVWVNTESIDDEFIDEVEALIDFAQDHGARLNVKCFNELKDLFTVKHAPYDI